MLYLGTDHAGYNLKEYIRTRLAERQISFEDLGAFSKEDSDDYPGYAKRVTKAVLKHHGKGILICDSGEGMAMAANRYKGIRAAICWSGAVARVTREDNDANILVLPAHYIEQEKAWEIVTTFLSTTFGYADRHKRRIGQMDEK